MKVSVNWLSEFCELPDIKTLVNDLNRIGFEVEGIDRVGDGLSHIVIGQIESFVPHPEADRLRIAQVRIGKETIQLVTAADNVSDHDKIPVSLPGATLASGLTITKSTLRGVESTGMMCSAIECGVTEHAPGVWVLPKSAPVGEDFISYAKLVDIVLDLAVLPNRGDCLSIYGIARECCALYGNTLNALPQFEGDYTPSDGAIQLAINSDICSYYQAITLSGLTCNDTPIWMQTRLYLAGMRPISWLVDVTNYVMIEFGQPMHAFDASGIQTISVDFGTDRDSVTLLNDQTVLANHLPIVRVNEAIGAIAGVMGSNGTDVTNKTQKLVLESAIFNATIVRQATKQLGLRSESSNRFEKGVDRYHLVGAVARVIQLLQAHNNGGICVHEPIIYEASKPKETKILVDRNQLNAFLGTSYTIHDMKNRLVPLGFVVSDNAIYSPSWRDADCENWQDIAEEMVRFDGMNCIEANANGPFVSISHDPLYQCQDALRRCCLSAGLTEIVPFPLVASDMIEDQPVIQNPISNELTVLQSNGIQAILACCTFNASRHAMPSRLFSIGPAWDVNGVESSRLTVFMQGSLHYAPYLKAHDSNMTFFHAKGFVEQLIATVLGRHNHTITVEVIPSDDANAAWFHPGQSARVVINNTSCGVFGVLHPTHQNDHQSGPAIAIELCVTDILALQSDNIVAYQPISKYPSTSRDITYIMPKSQAVADVLAILNKEKPTLCKDISLCGYYEPDDGSDVVNVSFRLVYQDTLGNLETEVVNTIHTEFAQTVIHAIPCRFPD